MSDKEVETYVSDDDDGSKQTRQRETVAHLLHQDTSRAKRRRRNEGAAVVVYNYTDGNVQRGHDKLAQRQSLEVLLVVLHLRHNVEVRRGTGVGEHQTGKSSSRFGKSGALKELEIGLPRTKLGCSGGAILETDRDGKGDDWCMLEPHLPPSRVRGNHLLAERIPARPTHAIQEILSRVWIDASAKPTMQATATKMAVHAPCSDSEFRPMEIPSIPEPATHVQTVHVSTRPRHNIWRTMFP